jgi:hypothetical protein
MNSHVNMMLKACGLFLAALFALSAHAELRVYLGTVGFEKGPGAAGHAFAIVQDSRIPDIAAEVYNYTVQNPDHSEITLTGALMNPGKAALLVEKLSLFDLYMGYAGALDRVISFHELNLTPVEAAKFSAALKADAEDKNFAATHTYNVFTRNCITRLIELLNAVVAPEKRIELIEDSASFSFTREGMSNGILNRLPFNVERVLDHHPISKGRVRILERLSDTHLRFLMAIGRRVETIGKTCGWKPESGCALLEFLALSEKAPRKHPAAPVLRTVGESCSAARAELGVIALILSRTMFLDELMDLRADLVDLGVGWAAP